MRFFSKLVVLLALIALLPAALWSQAGSDPCAPPFFNIYKEKNMFNDQQEVWLGEILDEQIARDYNAIADPDGDYLQKLGERLLAQLPPSGKQYSFNIIDYPVNNAFSVGGTRIYVSRQLIAFLKNEDELAGLVAHEIGHIATRQFAIDLTKVLRKMGVQQVGDRNDIFEKWNQLEDTWRKKHIDFRDKARSEEEQQIADRIGLYAMTRAGYQPSQLAAFFDRFTENKGKKGNVFTDIFGTTSPESKRVRLLINNAKPMAPECVAAMPPASDHFLQWQKAVIAAPLLEPSEQVDGIIGKSTLQPPLRGSLEYLQFSPDGKYLLARDASSVFVLGVHPLQNLFRFDALNAQTVQVAPGMVDAALSGLSDLPVQFTSDSSSVVFYDMELRVQKWDIASRQRTWVEEVPATFPGRCLRTSLSSTGEVLACVRKEKDDFHLLLIDVASGAPFFDKMVPLPYLPDFYDVAAQPFRFLPRYGQAWFAMGFSPDARYFVLGSGKMTIAYDLQARKEMPATRGVKRYTSARFVFTSPNQIVGLDPEHGDQAAMLKFPSGDVDMQFPLKINGQPLVNVLAMEGKLMAPGRGAYLLVSPAGRWPMAVFDLEAKDFLLGYKSPGLAIYSQTLAGEELGGKVTLFNLFDKKSLATVQLPQSPLPGLAAAEFSTDGKWLAVAGRTSGGVWSAETGERVLDTGTFTGSFFDRDQVFAIFHKLEQNPKIERLDLAARKQEDLYSLDLPDPKSKNGSTHHYIWQSGNLLLEQINKEEKQNCGSNISASTSACRFNQLCLTCKLFVEARDIRTNHVTWAHGFFEFMPKFYYSASSKTLTLLFESHYSVKAETKNNPKLKERFDQMPDKEALNLVEVLDPESGTLLGDLLMDTGNSSVLPRDAITAGDTVLVYDTKNRTHVYSLKSSAKKGHVPGKFQAISSGGETMLVENYKGECTVYETATLQALGRYKFPARLIRAEFTSTGSLLVLTANQTVYRLKVPAAPHGPAVTGSRQQEQEEGTTQSASAMPVARGAMHSTF
jgi:hypothetical protein